MIFIIHGYNKYIVKDLSDDSLVYKIRNEVGYIMYQFFSMKTLPNVKIDDSLERRFELIRAVFMTSRVSLDAFIDDCL